MSPSLCVAGAHAPFARRAGRRGVLAALSSRAEAAVLPSGMYGIAGLTNRTVELNDPVKRLSSQIGRPPVWSVARPDLDDRGDCSGAAARHVEEYQVGGGVPREVPDPECVLLRHLIPVKLLPLTPRQSAGALRRRAEAPSRAPRVRGGGDGTCMRRDRDRWARRRLRREPLTGAAPRSLPIAATRSL